LSALNALTYLNARIGQSSLNARIMHRATMCFSGFRRPSNSINTTTTGARH
jgi:hypothetical protein